MNIIAENITRRRKELNMTQRELADKLNVSDKTVSRWETRQFRAGRQESRFLMHC